MEESNNYGHQHPLLLILNEDQLIHNQSDITDCSRCAEKVSTPCFCCAEHCGLYLHKSRAFPLFILLGEGEMEESNNYGHQHPLLLILNQDQLIHNQSGVTHCSRCGEKVSAPCFCCAEHCGFYLHKEPLTNYTHFSPDCGFNLHEKCAELPFQTESWVPSQASSCSTI
ncbi:uncharacterized protein [Gossypium hirsutum]|uniref:Uncharacterized protein isoform X4 n=1 Tax=Gossypium hirsutum TaxID=3635 RepID=A0ABM2ZMQ4_GOSHI|nr:uncharacterized protein LOC107943512 isoform X4 [Gossypium hirsutum]